MRVRIPDDVSWVLALTCRLPRQDLRMNTEPEVILHIFFDDVVDDPVADEQGHFVSLRDDLALDRKRVVQVALKPVIVVTVSFVRRFGLEEDVKRPVARVARRREAARGQVEVLRHEARRREFFLVRYSRHLEVRGLELIYEEQIDLVADGQLRGRIDDQIHFENSVTQIQNDHGISYQATQLEQVHVASYFRVAIDIESFVPMLVCFLSERPVFLEE